jgi:hypothetical protein
METGPNRSHRYAGSNAEVTGMLDQMADIDPSYIKMMMEVVAANKPKKMGVVIFDYLSLEAAHQGTSFLRDMDIPSRV